MSDPSQTDHDPAPDETLEEDVQNDAVIGSALRNSLIVFCVAMFPIMIFLIYLNVTKKDDQTVEVEPQAPEARVIDDESLPTIQMTDVTAESGVQFKHHAGKAGEKLLPETMGSGVAVFDYNNDGNQDLLFINSTDWPWTDNGKQATCQLYQGDGQFHFTDVSQETGLDISLYGMGTAIGDYDNDGDQDVFISAVGGNRLLRNDDGKFTDVTEDSGVAGDEQTWSTSCGFFDYDNDGLLDLFVCNYVNWSRDLDLSQFSTIDGKNRAYGQPKDFTSTYSYLYHNDGDGKFTDVSKQSGIQINNDETGVMVGKAMGVVFTDTNRDGYLDIVVANDTVRNFLFENNHDGTFSETGRLAGIAFDLSSGQARGAMGIDASHFRPGGALAIGIGNFANEPSALYMSTPKRPSFNDAAMYTGFGPPTRLALTFGLFFFDADLDSRPDVFGANGHLEEEIEKVQTALQYAQPPQLFWNAGADAASELILLEQDCTGESFCEPIVGRGAAYGDFDNDGDCDIVVTASNGPAKLFRNDQATEHHFVRLRLVGTSSNRDAIGTQVSVTADGTTRTQTVMPTRSYLSRSENVLTFGLGDNTEIDEIEVTWPGQQPTVVTVDGIDDEFVIQQD
ncbi:ASPIC and UnbV [Stieleria bergensis]|uniref:ASPIC and UnbV n=1 Tax=Stieleria bergensis TaxID=2528025 RepID=A0A517SU93_9BACT|nr:ASPIC and UnbV [Planctomycetes bacterium SV_7m_r]